MEGSTYRPWSETTPKVGKFWKRTSCQRELFNSPLIRITAACQINFIRTCEEPQEEQREEHPPWFWFFSQELGNHSSTMGGPRMMAKLISA